MACVARRPPRLPERIQELVSAVANWAFAFIGSGRRQRTVTNQQVFARTREIDIGYAAAPQTDHPARDDNCAVRHQTA